MDDLLFQCLVLCIACIIVDNGRSCCHAVDDGGILIIIRTHYRVLYTSEEGYHDIGRIVVIHCPGTDEGIHLACFSCCQPAGLIIGLDLHVDADCCELLLDDLANHLVVCTCGRIITHLKGNFSILVACILQKLLCAVRIVNDLSCIVIVSKNTLRNDTVLKMSLSSVYGIQDCLTVNSHLDCMAYYRIREIIALCVHIHVSQGKTLSGNDIVRILCLISRRHDRCILEIKVDDIQLAVLIHQVLRGSIRDDVDHARIYRRLLSPVVFIFCKCNVIIVYPFCYDIRAGSDRLVYINTEIGSTLHGRLVDNADYRRCQLRNKACIRLCQRHADLVITIHLDS